MGSKEVLGHPTSEWQSQDINPGLQSGRHQLKEEMPGSSLGWSGHTAEKTSPLGTLMAQPRAWPDSLPEPVELN